MLVSILICTHNRAELLSRTLESLRSINSIPDVDTELLIVPNGCTDDTDAVIESSRRQSPFPIRSFTEKEANLNGARNRGVNEAKGEICAFLDDDVWVEPGWLHGLVHAYVESPADLLAGRTILWWETVQKPSWSSPRVERLLSRLDHGERILELQRPGQLVGANFSFKRTVFETIGGFVKGLDRAGDGLLSGGESEFVARAISKGFRLFYSPKMVVRHWVPKHRASKEYLSQLAQARGATRVALAVLQNRFQVRRFLQASLVAIVKGILQQSIYGLRGHEKGSFSGHLLMMRGKGILKATLRCLQQSLPGKNGRSRVII